MPFKTKILSNNSWLESSKLGLELGLGLGLGLASICIKRLGLGLGQVLVDSLDPVMELTVS